MDRKRAVYCPPMRRQVEAAGQHRQNALEAEREANRVRKLLAMKARDEDELVGSDRVADDRWTRAQPPAPSLYKAATAARSAVEERWESEPDIRAADARSDRADTQGKAKPDASRVASAGVLVSSADDEAAIHSASAAADTPRRSAPSREALATYITPGRRAVIELEAKHAEAAASRAKELAEAHDKERRHALEEARREGAERRARAAAEEEAAAARKKLAAAERKAAIQAEANRRAEAAATEAAKQAEARSAVLEQARREGAERRAERRETEEAKRALALDKARSSIAQGRTDAEEQANAEMRRRAEEEERERAAFPALASGIQPFAGKSPCSDSKPQGVSHERHALPTSMNGTADSTGAEDRLVFNRDESELGATSTPAWGGTGDEHGAAGLIPDIPSLASSTNEHGEPTRAPVSNAWGSGRLRTALGVSSPEGGSPSSRRGNSDEGKRCEQRAPTAPPPAVVANRLITSSLSLGRADARAAHEVAREKQLLMEETRRRREEQERTRRPW